MPPLNVFHVVANAPARVDGFPGSTRVPLDEAGTLEGDTGVPTAQLKRRGEPAD